MHSTLAFATQLVGDSQSMTMEAAMLGTPSLRCNTFAGRISVLNELEQKYGLTYGFRPDQAEKLLDRLEEMIRRPDLKPEWQQRRKRMLADKVDFAQWMIALVLKELESAG
jgi:hypothetical protein